MYPDCLSCRHFHLEVSQTHKPFHRSETLRKCHLRLYHTQGQHVCLNSWYPLTHFRWSIFSFVFYIQSRLSLFYCMTYSINNEFLWPFFLVMCTFTWCSFLSSPSHSERKTVFLFLWRGGSNVLSLLVEAHRSDYVGRIIFQSFNTMFLNPSKANFLLPLAHSLDTMGTESLYHRIVWVRMDLQRSSSRNPPPMASFTRPRCSKPLSNFTLSTSRNGASTTYLGTLLQCLTPVSAESGTLSLKL